jgi:hypothetical protein
MDFLTSRLGARKLAWKTDRFDFANCRLLSLVMVDKKTRDFLLA